MIGGPLAARAAIGAVLAGGIRRIAADTTRIWDMFTGTNGTSVSGRTPDTLTTDGATWTLVRGTINLFNEQARGEASPGGAGNVAVIDCSLTDYVITGTVNLGTANAVGILVRWAAAGNQAILVNFQAASQAVRMYSWNGTTYSAVTAGTGTALTAGTDYAFSVTVSGATVTAIINSITHSYSSVPENGSELVGFRVDGSVSNRVGEFKVVSS